MLRLIVFLIAAAALAWAAVWLANSPGEVVVTWDATETVLPFGIAIAIIAAVTAAGIVLYEVWRWFVGLPRRMRENRRHKRQLRGYQELTHGLIAAAAGDVTGARVHTRQAEKLLEANAATLLLSAQTAQLEGKEDVAQLKFQQMLKRPQTEFLGLRGLLADAVKRGEQEEALELARRAYERSPNTSWVLTTYFDLLTRAGKWAKALDLVGDMAREKLLSGAEATRRRALLKYMLALDALDAGDERLALDHGRKATGLAPAFSPAAVTASQAANRLGKFRLARRILEDCWRLEPHPELARAYADLLPSETAAERLKRFLRLERLRPDHVVTQMTMAEQAMRARHWETARKHLDKALDLEPTADTFRLYAEYERASGGGDAKARDWLAKAADAPADKCWVCDDTGEMLAEWQLFGPSGRFDSVRWEHPPTVATLLRDQRPAVVLVQDQTAIDETAGKDAAGRRDARKPATDERDDDDKPGGGQQPPRSSKLGGADKGVEAPLPIEATVKAAGGVS